MKTEVKQNGENLWSKIPIEIKKKILLKAKMTRLASEKNSLDYVGNKLVTK